MSQKPQISEQFIRELTGSQATLYAYILSLLPDREAARDVLQETNVVLWRKAEEFEPGSNFIAWAYNIVRHKVLAHHRDQHRDKHVFGDSVFDSMAAEADRQSQYAVEVAEAVEDCVEELSPRQRKLIRQKYQDGESIRDIAAARNQTPGSVSVALSLASAAP